VQKEIVREQGERERGKRERETVGTTPTHSLSAAAINIFSCPVSPPSLPSFPCMKRYGKREWNRKDGDEA